MGKIIENMKKNKKKWLWIGIPSFIVVLIIIFSITSAKRTTYTEEKVDKRDISTYYTATGNIEAKDKQAITTAMVTKIDKVYVEDGQRVKKGDILYSLDSSDINGSVNQARISANNAKTAYNNAKSSVNTALKEYNTTLNSIKQAQAAGMDTTALQSQAMQQQTAYNSAKSGVAQAKGQYALAKASYSAVLQQKNNLKIRATVSGVVTDLEAQSGQSYAPSVALMSVLNYDALKLDIKVDEYQIAKLEYGQKLSVNINSLNKTVKGKVDRISSQATVVNDVSYFQISLTIPYNSSLKVGMSAEVKIPKDVLKNTLSIKTDSLQFDVDKPFVYIKDANGKYIKQYVGTGVNQGEFIQITSGLEFGEMIYVPVNAKSAVQARMQTNRQTNNKIQQSVDMKTQSDNTTNGSTEQSGGTNNGQ